MWNTRTSFVCALILSAATLLPSAAAAQFGVSSWQAGTCKQSDCSINGTPEEFFTQAAGHPDYGITDFRFNSTEVPLGAQQPEGNVKDVRVDLPPGLAVNPLAVPTCEEQQLQRNECPAASQVGEDQASGTAEVAVGVKATLTERFPVYNMVHKPGEPARFGVEIKVPLLGVNTQSYIEGAISWHSEPETDESSGVASGDYHQYFRIRDLPRTPELVESRLIFWGVPHEHNPAAPLAAFLTMPSSEVDCTTPQLTYLHVDSYEDPGVFLRYISETRLADGTPMVATGCQDLTLDSLLSLTPTTTQSDRPDGLQVRLTVPQHLDEPDRLGPPDVQAAAVTLPDGVTINPSAAHGLQACSDDQIAIGTDSPIGCPAASQLGSVVIDAPGIPDGALVGQLYLAQQRSSDPQSGELFRVFLAAEASDYGVGLRLEGHVRADAATGQLTTTFADAPPVPFSDLSIRFKDSATAPLANPLLCGVAQPAALLTPYTAQPPTASASESFTVDLDGRGGACPPTPPFSPSQSSDRSSSSAGAFTSFTFDLQRAEGQQYLSSISTTLPAGLLARVPAVSVCPQAQAASGACPAASQIGQASVLAGAGDEPYPFSGPVYLTGPFGGGPYGLAVVVPASAGPFDLGTVIVRAAITVDPATARLTVSTPTTGAGVLPSVVAGVPVRLRTVQLAVNREQFMFNPTSCGPLTIDSMLRSTMAAVDRISTPFVIDRCTALAFNPVFAASTSARTSRRRGASLSVAVTQQPGQANIHEVHVALPSQLVARLSTLQRACPQSVFDADPQRCPVASRVGSAVVDTPVLRDPLRGVAYLVSHGAVAFPDLELPLSADGVNITLDGRTQIRGKITSSTFSALPDAPFTSFRLTLPEGPNSALAPVGNLCRAKLMMPTTIIAQNQRKITQQTPIRVNGCPRLEIIRRHVRKHSLRLLVRVSSGGLLKVSGSHLRTRIRHVRRSGDVRLAIGLSRRGRIVLARRHILRTHVRVSFRPSGRAAVSHTHLSALFRAAIR